jgi:LacI family transcriptional regulator
MRHEDTPATIQEYVTVLPSSSDWDTFTSLVTGISPLLWATAFGCLSWLQRQGVNVPKDVSILSFDGTQLFRMVTPRLTTLVQPVELIAQETFRILAGKDNQPEQIFLPPTLRDGDSTLNA